METDRAIYLDKLAIMPHFDHFSAETEEAQVDQLVRKTEHLFSDPGLDAFHRQTCRTLVEQVFVTTFATGGDPEPFDQDPAIRTMMRNAAIPADFWDIARPFFENARETMAP